MSKSELESSTGVYRAIDMNFSQFCMRASELHTQWNKIKGRVRALQSDHPSLEAQKAN